MKPLKEAIQEFEQLLLNDYGVHAKINYYTPGQTTLRTDIFPVIKEIFSAVEKATGYTPETLISESKKQALADCRTIAMYLVRYNTNLTFKEIGKIFGGRDHSTVKHNIDKYDSQLHVSDDFTDLQQSIMEHFAGIKVTNITKTTGGKSSIAKAVAAA